MLNVTADRYQFAVGLGAALLRGQTNLLPPNHTPDIVARLHSLFPSTYCIADDPARLAPLPSIPVPAGHAPIDTSPQFLQPIAPETLAAHVLTSGSTGDPVPHPKQWSLLTRNIEAGARRLARHMNRADLDASKDQALEQTWDYVKYELTPQTTNVVAPNGTLTTATTYVKTPVGRLTISFKGDIVESLDQSEGTIFTGGETTIVTPPVVVYW